MKKKLLTVLAALLVLALSAGIVAAGTVNVEIKALLNKIVKVSVDGEPVQLRDSKGKVQYPITYNGEYYIPLSSLEAVTNKPASYNSKTNTINFGEAGDTQAVIDSKKTPSKVKIKAFSVSKSGMFVAAVADDGSVWSWGYNESGQLGDGTNTDRSTPVRVKDLSDVKKVVCGLDFGVALKNDGTVWVWGGYTRYWFEYLKAANKTTAAQVKELENIKDIACGQDFVLLLKNDGTVWSFGENGYGQVGNGNKYDMLGTSQVKGLDHIKGISCNAFSSFVLKEDGTVWAWGRDSTGELGIGTPIGKDYDMKYDRTTPVKITSLSNVKLLGSGGNSAIKEDGTVWVWGYNQHGNLGDGTIKNRNLPVQLTKMTGAKSIAGSSGNGIILKSDGTVYITGSNSRGQLGNGKAGDSLPSAPFDPKVDVKEYVKVSGLTKVKAVDTYSGVVMVLLEDGTLWGWGSSAYGQLGYGKSGGDTLYFDEGIDKARPTQVIFK